MASILRGVIYLERERFLLSIENRVDIITYTYPPNLVNNLDILDVEAFKKNLQDFLDQNKVELHNLVIVLSSAIIFERDFKVEDEEAIKSFLDNVPFETISIKRVPTAEGVKVLVGNAFFYNTVADVFIEKGVALSYVIPEIALGTNIGAFSAATARLILAKSEALSQYMFVVDQSTNTTVVPAKAEPVAEVKKKNSSLIYLLPVMGLLLLVLIFLIVQPFFVKSKPKHFAQTVPPVPIAQPTAHPITTTPIVSSASADVHTRKPHTGLITYDQTASVKADAVKSILLKFGVADVQTATASISLASPLVIFANDLDTTVKMGIAADLKQLLPDATIQEASTLGTDISITIGK